MLRSTEPFAALAAGVAAGFWLLVSVPNLLAQPPITALAISPDGSQVVVGSQAGVTVYRRLDADAKAVVERTLDIDLPQVHDLAFSPRGNRIAVAGGRPSEYGEVILLQWPSGQMIWKQAVHDDVVYRIAWDSSGDMLAAASGDHRVACLSADTGEPTQWLLGHSRPVLAAAFLPDGRHLVTGGADRSMRVWDVASGKTVRILDQHTGEVVSVASRADNSSLPMIASVSADRTLRFWQPTRGRLVRFVRFPVAPLSIAWLADGIHVAVGCEDGHLRVVNSESLDMVSDRAILNGWVYEVASSTNPTAWIAAGGSNARWLIQSQDFIASKPLRVSE